MKQLEHRARIKEGGFEICCNDYHDVMVAARIGKNGSVRQTAGCKTDDIFMGNLRNCERYNKYTGDFTKGRMSMHRVCVYHIGQDHVSRAAALCGEIFAAMCWECICYQVDVMAGDGNKAACLCTPKNLGCPTDEVSLLQFWINRMMNTATQSRLKNCGLTSY